MEDRIAGSLQYRGKQHSLILHRPTVVDYFADTFLEPLSTKQSMFLKKKIIIKKTNTLKCAQCFDASAVNSSLA